GGPGSGRDVGLEVADVGGLDTAAATSALPECGTPVVAADQCECRVDVGGEPPPAVVVLHHDQATTAFHDPLDRLHEGRQHVARRFTLGHQAHGGVDVFLTAHRTRADHDAADVGVV